MTPRLPTEDVILQQYLWDALNSYKMKVESLSPGIGILYQHNKIINTLFLFI